MAQGERAGKGFLEYGAASVARARAKLALRANRAWGLVAMLDTGDCSAPQVALNQAEGPPQRGRSLPTTASVEGLFAAPAVAPITEAALDHFGKPLPRQRRIELLQRLDEGEIRVCSRCTLCGKRTNTVFGEGDPEARLMFIGEGPGETEDLTGRPFVGRAGELLEKMIQGMGLRRQEVYIANVVKCRPPYNRVPTAQEVETCTPYLHKQIEWVRPDVIVTLGLPATRHLLKTNASMGALRGRWSHWRGIKLMPTYHPAFLLRSYTAENRRIVWEDLKQVMGALGLPVKNAEAQARTR